MKNCNICGLKMSYEQEQETLRGYIRFDLQHIHDDNCLTRVYHCANGHVETLSKQRTCPNCDWKGKLTCFCHAGNKLEKWPEE